MKVVFKGTSKRTGEEIFGSLLDTFNHSHSNKNQSLIIDEKQLNKGVRTWASTLKEINIA